MKTVLTGIVTGIVLVFLIQVFLSPCAMAEKPKEQPVEGESAFALISGCDTCKRA